MSQSVSPTLIEVVMPLGVAIVLALIFVIWPQIDIAFSQLFYSSEENFVYKNNLLVTSVYSLFRDMPRFLLPVLVLVLIFSLFNKLWLGRSSALAEDKILAKKLRKPWLFLFLVLLIGPGIIVHLVFKENFDRPRPRAVQEFSGTYQFSPAFVIAGESGKHKSFMSGHAAMGFFFIAFAWLVQCRRLLLLGVLIGSLVSFGRILQGGHFLSDVIFPAFVCYFTCQIVAYFIYGSVFIRRPE